MSLKTTTDLLPHQVPAVEKLQGLKVGALFMDMGTGKSRCAIELAARRRHKINKLIWFAPNNLKETVRYEIDKHSTGETVNVFGSKTNEQDLPNAFWHVVGIEGMSSSKRLIYAADALVDKDTMVIVDESSFIKGHDSQRTEWITRLGERAKYRLIMSGTPVSQGIVDLYSQMRFLSLQILGFRSFYSFAKNHLVYSEKYPGVIRRSLHTDVIAGKIAPYVYQVKKEDCLTLPEKLYNTYCVSMTGLQRELYEQAKAELLDELVACQGDDWASRHAILRLFGVLQQITCGFWNRRNKENGTLELYEVGHERLNVLAAALAEIPKGEKVIIWCKFRRSVEAICKMLGDAAVPYFSDLNEQQRLGNLTSWRREKQYFVATTDSGGHGLTLIESAYSVFYENTFKYSVRIQAEDRIHRIGQTRKPTYIDITCTKSIDERIIEALTKKGDTVEAFVAQVKAVHKDKGRAGLASLIAAL
jgi:SNF2 family DNA or RNA helicase